jgi:hypothetical protein
LLVGHNNLVFISPYLAGEVKGGMSVDKSFRDNCEFVVGTDGPVGWVMLACEDGAS